MALFPQRILRACVLALAAAAPAGMSGAAELSMLMVEQPGCHYCIRFDDEIAPKWPKTDEGRAAPLQRMRMGAEPPEGVTLDSPPPLTPTFVVLVDGAEHGRLIGYPGEDFFWPMIAQLIERAETDLTADQAEATP